ncbi:hypothetical protein [Brachybacterium sp. J153]|uniref:hypothetical protein n=1 Tax=Brachybacterium sp. J153 TaxID=3116488 RepID=UPI002E79611E|nr:hypothetical protein [Brachybacterium sp. J153]MEE1618933.1 hypothetical protein [Brachybacterium sp. J153]
MKKHTTSPSSAQAGIPYQVRGSSCGATRPTISCQQGGALPRHEHRRRDREALPQELHRPDDVLEELARLASADHRLELRRVAGGTAEHLGLLLGEDAARSAQAPDRRVVPGIDHPLSLPAAATRRQAHAGRPRGRISRRRCPAPSPARDTMER